VHVLIGCAENCVFVTIRYRGKCKPCPNTAWLIFVALFVVLAALVAASVYMSKRRINMAALGIGVVSDAHVWTLQLWCSL
jgi:hypothetical protein